MSNDNLCGEILGAACEVSFTVTALIGAQRFAERKYGEQSTRDYLERARDNCAGALAHLDRALAALPARPPVPVPALVELANNIPEGE